jgi:hypothetical protein
MEFLRPAREETPFEWIGSEKPAWLYDMSSGFDGSQQNREPSKPK